MLNQTKSRGKGKDPERKTCRQSDGLGVWHFGAETVMEARGRRALTRELLVFETPRGSYCAQNLNKFFLHDFSAPSIDVIVEHNKRTIMTQHRNAQSSDSDRS